MQDLHNRDAKLRKATDELLTFGGYATDEISRMYDTAAWIQKIIDGDLNA